MFRLESERLVIRPWTPDDRPAFTALARNPEVMRFVHRGEPYTDDEVEEFFRRQARQLEEHGVCIGPMIEKASGRIVGIAGTQPMGRDFEIGWWLDPAVWGRGYATEAGGAAMRYVLDVLRRPRVVAIIDPPNEPSKRVAERLGMRYDARYTGEQLGHRLPHIVVDQYIRDRDVRDGAE